MPVVLIPVHFDRDPALRQPSCGRSVVLRPFLSNDFMTGVPVVPDTERLPLVVSVSGIGPPFAHSSNWFVVFSAAQVLDQMVREIQKVDGISRVLYDLTSKPPGTTEWE